MYIQYKVNLSENQVDTLKDAIRFKKVVTLCLPKGGIRGDHVLLLTPLQINRLDKAQVEGRRVQIRTSARQVPKNVSYNGFFFSVCWHHSQLVPYHSLLVLYLPSCQDLQLVYFLVGSKAISGDGLYVHKHDKCCRVQKSKGNGVYLAPEHVLSWTVPETW